MNKETPEPPFVQKEQKFIKLHKFDTEDFPILEKLSTFDASFVAHYHNFFAGNPDKEYSLRNIDRQIEDAETAKKENREIDIWNPSMVIEFFKLLRSLTKKYSGFTMMALTHILEGE